MAICNQNGQDTKYYIHKDYLGSWLCITNQAGQLLEERSFDAWGRRRNPTNWTYTSIPFYAKYFTRGYTTHEHLDKFALINMNGRMYDPVVGRFLSTDNFVQSPGITQAYNRYSYCLNNPLKYTDPNGLTAWYVVLGKIFLDCIVIPTIVGNTITILDDWINKDVPLKQAIKEHQWMIYFGFYIPLGPGVGINDVHGPYSNPNKHKNKDKDNHKNKSYNQPVKYYDERFYSGTEKEAEDLLIGASESDNNVEINIYSTPLGFYFDKREGFYSFSIFNNYDPGNGTFLTYSDFNAYYYERNNPSTAYLYSLDKSEPLLYYNKGFMEIGSIQVYTVYHPHLSNTGLSPYDIANMEKYGIHFIAVGHDGIPRGMDTGYIFPEVTVPYHRNR